MTCKEIMTPNPSCCLPSDTVAVAAQIMRRNDVGSVLIVSDHEENRLLGIVTDRDLAIKVIADGRDPNVTRVDEVMSLHPVSCNENDRTSRALQLMAEHQVRRIPVVDDNGRVCGIVAQADVALHEDEEEVGRMVEQISEPYGSSSWTEIRESRLGDWTNRNSLALGSLCIGLGAGLMYVLEESRGGRSGSRLNAADSGLLSTIRSNIRQCVSSPDAIDVQASNGHVTLSGPVLANEVRTLLDSVTGLDGVRSLESRLDVHDYPESHPALQGRKRPAGAALSLLAGLAAGGLLWYQRRSRSPVRQHRHGETPGY
jgi:CBS domain-containing protein